MKESQIPFCPRCNHEMIAIERKEEADLIKIDLMCHIYNNKNNPFMKLMLGENHEFFKEQYKEVNIDDLLEED